VYRSGKKRSWLNTEESPAYVQYCIAYGNFTLPDLFHIPAERGGYVCGWDARARANSAA